MHLLLTDRLVCPRCGPPFGLILLADEVRERRILRGRFGCSNCRDAFPVEGGFGDLRPPPRRPLPPAEAPPSPPDPEASLRLAALLGVTEGPGMILIRGPAAEAGPWLASRLAGVEVVVEDPSVRRLHEAEGLSRMVAGLPLPFFPASFRGVVLSGSYSPEDLAEAVRVVAPGARVVALGAPGGTAEKLAELGAELLWDEGGVVVGRVGRPQPPLVSLKLR